jgi:DNA modification methylase
LAELRDSIASIGLLHPPVVRQDEHGFLAIVAGERRFRAIKELFDAGQAISFEGSTLELGFLPVTLLSELPPELAMEIELQENIIRQDLSWQERANAVAKLHALRLSQNPAHTQQDTAEEITGGPSTNATAIVRDRVILAKNLYRKAVAGAPTEAKALRILRHELESDLLRAAEERGILRGHDVAGASPHTLVCGDALLLLDDIPNGYFDVILTDPPYGVEASGYQAGIVVTHDYKDDWESAAALMQAFAPKAFRVAARQAHLYLFCDILRFFHLQEIFNLAGWSVWPRPFIWVKDVGFIPNASLGPSRNYECVLYGNKGNRTVNALYRDVIQVPGVRNKLHAAQKPVDLYVDLLKRSVLPGSRVLDPFCGSGTIFPAANRLGVIAHGYELDEAHVGKARLRLSSREDAQE